MKKTVLISYDLKNVKSGDNERIKQALLSDQNTKNELVGFNNLSKKLEWVSLTLPETTLLAEVPLNVSMQFINQRVNEIIKFNGAEAGKIFIAQLSPDFYLYNSENK